MSIQKRQLFHRFRTINALFLSRKYLQYSIDITTEQSFKCMEFIDAKIWISKNASLCRVFANRVTYIVHLTPLPLRACCDHQ